VPYMYILQCSDATYYVGSTWDLERRLAEHSSGHGAAYTRRRRPVELVYCEEYGRIDEAYAREKQVQNWSRAKREALMCGDEEGLRQLAKKPKW
jgi:putative endonuclease